MVFVAFCCNVLDIQQSHRVLVCTFEFFRDVCALELLAGRVFVDVILQQICQMLLVEFVGQKSCWTCVRYRHRIGHAGWDRCTSIVKGDVPLLCVNALAAKCDTDSQDLLELSLPNIYRGCRI